MQMPSFNKRNFYLLSNSFSYLIYFFDISPCARTGSKRRHGKGNHIMDPVFENFFQCLFNQWMSITHSHIGFDLIAFRIQTVFQSHALLERNLRERRTPSNQPIALRDPFQLFWRRFSAPEETGQKRFDLIKRPGHSEG